jgi:hypothetical protein
MMTLLEFITTDTLILIMLYQVENSIRINGTGSVRWRNGSGSFNAFRIYGVDSNKNGTQLGEHSSYSGWSG